MLKTYEVIIENGQIKWLKEQPQVKLARAIVTLLEEDVPTRAKSELLMDQGPKLKDLGGSEPEVQAIPRRRHNI